MVDSGTSTGAAGTVGILCALPEELGELRDFRVGVREGHGLEILELSIEGVEALACVGGVGKVLAARAATRLITEGAERALLCVGVCGGLKRDMPAGTLVHCERAVQSDSAIRQTREVTPEPVLLEAWSEVVPGRRGFFLTADRPAISPWRRMRLARAYLGSPVADMETASAALVARSSGVPWAALRAVTDGVWRGGSTAFKEHYPAQAGRAADTIPALLRRSAWLS